MVRHQRQRTRGFTAVTPAHRHAESASGSGHRGAWFLLPLLGVVAVVVGFQFADRAKSTPRPERLAAAVGAVRVEDLLVETHIVPVPEADLAARLPGPTTRWTLPGYSRAHAAALLSEVRGAAAALSCDGAGCAAEPAPDALAALTRAARSSLYPVLAGFAGNPQADSVYRLPERGPFSAVPELPAAARPLVDALTWHRNGVPAFSDGALVCARLGSATACRDFLRAMLSPTSAAVMVRVTEPGAIDRFVATLPAGDRDGARSQLHDARLAGVTRVPLDLFVSGWARSRLDTFPAAGEAWANPLWTALRFVNRARDANDPVPTPEAFDARLAEGFTRVAAGPQLGDVLVLRDGTRRAVHAASWLAGEYLYEKRGATPIDPWRIAHLTEVMAAHPETESTEIWRPREVR